MKCLAFYALRHRISFHFLLILHPDLLKNSQRFAKKMQRYSKSRQRYKFLRERFKFLRQRFS